MLFITPTILLGYIISGSTTLAKPAGWKTTGTAATTTVTDASAATDLSTKTVCIVGPSTAWGTTHPGATFTSVAAIPPPPAPTGVATKRGVAPRYETASAYLPPPGDVIASIVWPWYDAADTPGADLPSSSPLPWHTVEFYSLAVADASGATTVFAPIPSTTLGDGTWCDVVEVDGTTVSEISTATSSTATATPTTTSAVIQELNKSSGVASTRSKLPLVTFIAGGLFGVAVGFL